MNPPTPFHLSAPFHPTGDQPEAIRQLVEGIHKGYQNQVLLGTTGTGKTYTMAQVITQLHRPALVANSHIVCPSFATRKNVFDLSDDISQAIFDMLYLRNLRLPGHLL